MLAAYVYRAIVPTATATYSVHTTSTVYSFQQVTYIQLQLLLSLLKVLHLVYILLQRFTHYISLRISKVIAAIVPTASAASSEQCTYYFSDLNTLAAYVYSYSCHCPYCNCCIQCTYCFSDLHTLVAYVYPTRAAFILSATAASSVHTTPAIQTLKQLTYTISNKSCYWPFCNCCAFSVHSAYYFSDLNTLAAYIYPIIAAIVPSATTASSVLLQRFTHFSVQLKYIQLQLILCLLQLICVFLHTVYSFMLLVSTCG